MPTVSAENLQLVRSFQLTGDHAAAERLLSLNAPVLRGMAREVLPPVGCLEFDDVLIEGQLGLLAAAARFDLSRGFQFLTFARWRIAQAMNRLVERENRVIHVPADAAAQARREGTVGELPQVTASLDQHSHEDEAGTLGDLFPASWISSPR
jgi:DNA-directed RNA polymerase specialized sigma subunit